MMSKSTKSKKKLSSCCGPKQGASEGAQPRTLKQKLLCCFNRSHPEFSQM